MLRMKRGFTRNPENEAAREDKEIDQGQDQGVERNMAGGAVPGLLTAAGTTASSLNHDVANETRGDQDHGNVQAVNRREVDRGRENVEIGVHAPVTKTAN